MPHSLTMKQPSEIFNLSHILKILIFNYLLNLYIFSLVFTFNTPGQLLLM